MRPSWINVFVWCRCTVNILIRRDEKIYVFSYVLLVGYIFNLLFFPHLFVKLFIQPASFYFLGMLRISSCRWLKDDPGCKIMLKKTHQIYCAQEQYVFLFFFIGYTISLVKLYIQIINSSQTPAIKLSYSC